jgi:hypothetical protein
MRYILLLLACSLFVDIAIGQSKDEEAIKRLLQRQTSDWNKGNIDGFMNGYWQSDSLLFIGKNGPKYGYQTTLNNYKKNYPDTAAMGKLAFDILQIKRLSVLYFFVVGKWHLQRSIGNLEGHFTLLFKKVTGQWVIVADHSS